MEVEQEAEQQQPSVRQNWLQSGFLKAVISPRGGKQGKPDQVAAALPGLG